MPTWLLMCITYTETAAEEAEPETVAEEVEVEAETAAEEAKVKVSGGFIQWVEKQPLCKYYSFVA